MRIASLVQEEIRRVNLGKLHGWKKGLFVGLGALIGTRVLTSAWNAVFGNQEYGYDILPPEGVGYGSIRALRRDSTLTTQNREFLTDIGSPDRASHRMLMGRPIGAGGVTSNFGLVQGLYDNRHQ